MSDTSKLTVQWGLSRDGHCQSRDGRFQIAPHYCGLTKPQWFSLKDTTPQPLDEGRVATVPQFRTMRLAKQSADRKVRREMDRRVNDLMEKGA